MKRMKIGLAVLLVFGLLGICVGYTRDVSRDLDWAILYALEAIITATETSDDAIKVDDAAFTPATSSVSMMGAEFDDATPDSVDEGDAGSPRMSANRNLYTTIRDAAGGERGANVDASNQLGVVEASGAAIAADANELTAAPIKKTPTVIVQAVATPTTAEALAGSATYARKVYLMAEKATGANTGLVFIGTSAIATGAREITLAPGDSIVIDPGLGCKVDLNEIFVDAINATDGVTGWYIPI